MSNLPHHIAALAFDLIDQKLWNTADSMIAVLRYEGWDETAQFIW